MSERTAPKDDLSSRVPAGIFRKEARELRAAAQERRRLLALDTWWTKGGFWTLLVGTAVLTGAVGLLPMQQLARGRAVVHVETTGTTKTWTAFAILPDEHRTSFATGKKLALHTAGGVREAPIDFVSDVVTTPEAVRRLVPPRVSSALDLQGPSVVVRASLPHDARHGMFDGATFDADITLAPTPAATWLFTSLDPTRTP